VRGAVRGVDHDREAVEPAREGFEEMLDVELREDRIGVTARGGAGELSSIRRSIAASTASGSLRPAAEKILMPLSRQGLWEAETTTPASAARARTRWATAGVGTTPAR